MAFKLDKNNTGFQIIEEGVYEVYPTVYAITKSQSGNEMAQFNYVIRDDVDQKFKGQQIRYDNFVDTEGAHWRINQASKAAGLDMEKEYDSIEEWAKDFVNKAICVRVGHREYNGKVYPEIREFLPSQVGGTYTLVEKPNNDLSKQDDDISIGDDDLPF